MKSPYPGMDPYLEHPAIWSDVHISLNAAIADALTPFVAPKYYVGLKRHAFALTTAVLEIDLPMDEVEEQSYLEVREVKTGILATVLEVLSPVNKLHPDGRGQYEAKRDLILRSRTSFVEIDLLRAGEPLATGDGLAPGGYRILVSRAWERPRAKLHAFGVRAAIPRFPLPLLPEDGEPEVDLNAILHGVYERARFDLRLDYDAPPVPPLSASDAEWSRGLHSN